MMEYFAHSSLAVENEAKLFWTVFGSYLETYSEQNEKLHAVYIKPMACTQTLA